MTVRDLIEKLQELPQDYEVQMEIVSGEPEDVRHITIYDGDKKIFLSGEVKSNVQLWEEEEVEEHYDDRDYDPDYDDLIDGVGFADPGGRSALRAATRDNPRNLPCPQCGRPNMLTPIDRSRGYRCDICSDQAEGRMGGYDY